ncbi:MAG: DNA repair protein RadA [Clostridiales Family XIII bacterium]|jgi:DNA repair protein RadA/Sms|nr:DNA repair protein RadA [Clostridiales Family XIII bacterium]
MAKSNVIFMCSECGYESPKWMGQCICGAWNSFVEIKQSPASAHNALPQSPSKPLRLRDVISAGSNRLDTGLPELNRVLGGGLTPGSLTLIAGEPGIGKSTLILQSALALAGRGLAVLYTSGEESAEQIRLRADRLSGDNIPESLYIFPETDISSVAEAARGISPSLLIIDSIQTMRSAEIPSTAGGVSQIRACADALMRIGKAQGIPVFIVAHVTKSGEVAGPKIIEHLVDCVLDFSGEKDKDYRILTASKNRFGNTNEPGAFEMKEEGLSGIDDLSGLLLGGITNPAEGTIAGAVFEGTRPLLMEIQALTASSALSFPRRTSIGVDGARLAMLLAVLEKKLSLDLAAKDVFINIVGGFKPGSASTDLAAALAIWSSARSLEIQPGTLAVGEIDLAGEVRPVRGLDRIVSEAARLGLSKAILPKTAALKVEAPRGLSVLGVSSLNEAIEALLS